MTSRDSVMISNEKQTLRVKMQAEIRRFVEKDAASKKIRQHLRDWEAWKSARVFLVSWPFPASRIGLAMIRRRRN